jgi:hypothetical protein
MKIKCNMLKTNFGRAFIQSGKYDKRTHNLFYRKQITSCGSLDILSWKFYPVRKKIRYRTHDVSHSVQSGRFSYQRLDAATIRVLLYHGSSTCSAPPLPHRVTSHKMQPAQQLRGDPVYQE